MPLIRPVRRPPIPRSRLGTRIVRPAGTTAPPPTLPPVVITATDLAEGTGTRSFQAVDTLAGDDLVVEYEVADNDSTSGATPSGGSLTYLVQNDTGTPGGAGDSHARVIQWTAHDAAGGTRTVQIAPGGTLQYRARLTVVRGSTGPSGKANTRTGQTVSATRTGADSMLFMAVVDWSAGAVGSPTWTPGGYTVASEQGAGATYLFGRWDDSGAAGTASHGISAPAYTTPSVAVLEMLGTTPVAGPAPRPQPGPVRAKTLPARAGRVLSRAGVFTAVAPTFGPPVYPLGHPVQARRLPQRGGQATGRDGAYGGVGPPVKPPEGPVQAKRLPTRGGSVQARDGLFGGVGPALKALAGAVTARLRTLPPRGRVTNRSGVYAGLGPPVKPAEGPVAAKLLPQRGGRVANRAGTFTATAPTAGPPIYPLGHPVQARRLLARGGRVTRAAGTYAGTGPAVKPAEGPVRAQALPARGGRVVARAGTFTAGAPPAGPPVYPLGHPVCARRPPARGGYVNRRSGPYAGTGPAAPQLRQPVAGGRQQPPPPVRGRIASLRGPFQGTGPKVRPLQGPVRSRLPGPVRFGRVDTTLLPAVAVPPPAFSVGGITAGTASTAGIGGGASGTAGLAATTSVTSSVAAGASQTGGVSAATAPTGGP